MSEERWLTLYPFIILIDQKEYADPWTIEACWSFIDKSECPDLSLFDGVERTDAGKLKYRF